MMKPPKTDFVIDRTYKRKRDKRLTISLWCFAAFVLIAWVVLSGCESDRWKDRLGASASALEEAVETVDYFYENYKGKDDD